MRANLPGIEQLGEEDFSAIQHNLPALLHVLVVQTEGDEPAKELSGRNNGCYRQIRIPHGSHRFPHGCV